MALDSEIPIYKQQQQQQQQQKQQQRQPLQNLNLPNQFLKLSNVGKQQPPSLPQVLRTRTVCAPYKKSSHNNNSNYLGTTLDSNNPAVIRRNARERNRVKQVNNGFYNLRQHIPNAIIAEVSNGRRGIGPGANKKLSKVDTLRTAVEYIRRLKNLIDEIDNSDASSVSSFGSQGSGCTSSIASSPVHPASVTYRNYYHHQPMGHCAYSINSATNTSLSVGSFQPTEQTELISPTQSQVSDGSDFAANATGYFMHSPTNTSYNCTSVSSTPVKYEQQANIEDYSNNCNNSSADDDDELLEYISLWQDE